MRLGVEGVVHSGRLPVHDDDVVGSQAEAVCASSGVGSVEGKGAVQNWVMA
jgi:hypothetical protein